MSDPKPNQPVAIDPVIAAKRLARAQAQVAVLEKLIEDKSRELFFAAQHLDDVFQATPTALIVCDPTLTIERCNTTAERLVGRRSDDMQGLTLAEVLGSETLEKALAQGGDSIELALRLELTCRPFGDGAPFPIVLTLSRGPERAVVALQDVRREKQLELELRHAQKLEAVGQLAAGVAHEINTPIQFVGDSLYFLRDAFQEVLEVAEGKVASEQADLPYLVENVPAALTRCEQGITRVTEIVRALKELSHPDGRDKAPADLNRAIENALVVARNEYKHLAELETEFGSIPTVECHLGDIGQLLLNLLVNAAHAIEERIERHPERGKRGRLEVRTVLENSCVHISVADDGAGIPEAVRDRLFEPFFTTKPVGKGTGQGLSIARSIVVDRHGGELTFESEVGVGTTFHVRLPIRAAEGARMSRPKRAA